MLRPWQIEMELNIESSIPIYQQIADYIINAIKGGLLKPGDVLPGTRQLSLLLKVNRNTVVKAYDVLLSSEWLVSSDRRGTFVSGDADGILHKASVLYCSKEEKAARSEVLFFDSGLPDTSIAPVDELGRAYRRIFGRQAKWQMLKMGSEYGDVHFREIVSQMINYGKGLSTSSDTLCITRGTQMSLYLVAHALLSPGDVVLVESPGYGAAWRVFEDAGVRLQAIRVDEEGINVDEVERAVKLGGVSALYITPHHQYPTTVTLSLERRLRLIALSNQYGFTVIEDDYDSDYCFGLRPKRPVSSHAELERFVYMGTFSKLIAPAIRMGYMYSSRDVIEKVGRLRRLIDYQGDTIMEQSLGELVESGDVRRHIRRALACYRKRRDRFAELLEQYAGGKVGYKVPDGGLAYWLMFADEFDLSELRDRMARKGVMLRLPEYAGSGCVPLGIRVGYASLCESDMERGVRILGECVG